MKLKVYSLLLISVFATTLLSAQWHTKYDLRLWKRLHDGDIRKQNMPLLVRGDMEAIRALTERLGGHYKYGYNNISSIDIPEMNLFAFEADKAVEKIEHTGGKGVFLMDSARIRNNIDSVHAGFPPLPHNLKGRNVVVGIIDGGIYFQHYDFKKPTDSTTRIRYIWDQVVNGNAPSPFAYGYQWDSSQINNGTCTHSPPLGDNGHGTCVAGIAAGNSLSNKGTAYENQFTGVAPEADIIAVRILDDNNFLPHVADAVNYIFTKATELGKPCVINTSIGTYYGSHDGIDLATQMMETMLDQQSGRVLVAAAGNAGNIRHHVGYDIPADSAYTYFTYNPGLGYHYFDFWADTANFNNALFKVGASTNTGTPINSTQYFSVPVDFNPTPGNAVVLGPFSLTNGGSTDDVYIAASIYGSRYQVEFQIFPSDNSNYWRLQTTGSGKLDLWASSVVIGSSDIADELSGNIYITDLHYRHPDSLKTMVSSWQNSDKVITVGNYSNRAGYLDYYGNYNDLTTSPYNEVVGKRFFESSLGPTRDDRLKPDIMATGSTTITTGDPNYISALIGSGQGYKVSITGKQVRNGGTSMASPIVAGIAALYLEKRPNATYQEIKQALICSATKDAFTGNSPNPEYGNGKVNAFAALTSATCVIYGSLDTACFNYNPISNFDTGCVAKVRGITDTACINYNPLANIDSGTCIPKVYGCTDTGSINYNALANVNDGSCVTKIYGCMDTASINYNALANVDDGSCIAKVYGCTDTGSINYNALANVNDGSCIAKVYGCMDTASINYNAFANTDDGSCIAKVYGCTDTGSINYNPLANVNDGSCIAKVYGCMDTASINYNAFANTDDGSCIAKVYGCTDTGSINYNALANVNDGSCIAKVYGCMDTASINYNTLANVNDGSCIAKVYGCMDTASINYNASANVNDGSCIVKVYGCNDTGSINYNALANVNDGSCIAKVYGCMDTASINYNASANVNDGSCIAKVYGCTDTGSINYNALANVNDGSCISKVYGCMDTASINYNALANTDDGSCIAKVYGCTDTGSINYNALANVNDGSCIAKVYGCIDTASINYNALANVDDGSCVAKVYGCTDTGSINYNALANINDGSCIAKVYGCMDTASINYNAAANVDNGGCIAKVYGVTDTGCINYSASANVDNGTCVAKVYGCTDTAATNYNPLANVNDGTCHYLSIGNVPGDNVTVQVVPNPFTDQTTFRINGLRFEQGSIRIFNVLGELVDEIALTKNKNEYVYTNTSLSKHVYFYLVTADGKNLKAGKLVVE